MLEKLKRIPYLGPSGYAIMNSKFPVRKFLQQYPDSLNKLFLPILYPFFGKNWDAVTRFLVKFKDKKKLLEFHLCFRNPDPNMVKYAKNIVYEMERLQYSKTKIIVCPILEDNISDAEWKWWAAKVRCVVPYRIVRSSLKFSATGGKYEEKHGKYPIFRKPFRCCIANPDGVTVDFDDGERYLHNRSDRDRYIMDIEGAKKYIRRAKEQHLFAAAVWSANQQRLGQQADWGNKPPVNGPDVEYIVTDKAVKGMQEILSA